ncbi:MAG: DUF4101 domain-containing protein [Pelatocladus maniniholoensis HA4357-MV3]|jgi:serine/threonine protein kinase|uniref:non-specific serine/threonine protein kinase n=1 Tax=Pelatocladus maniniholoensis HA4357-MV3 TaxID=1117104 RepID=A0A9E3H9T1_9NOST|nr:DUF4101 domain-containing protein [Pelatocladus maniniholoensis HA4357-MV3]
MVREQGDLVHKRYQIKHILTQKTFEVTYLTQDQVQCSENCVLREFISTEIGKAAIVGEQFQQQLSKLQGIKNPQIQQLQDFFWESERLFIVQNYIDGQSYQDLVRSRSVLNEAEAIELLNQILPVLSYLHSQQITHGDISPSNILLQSHDNLPVLTNFGVIADILTQMGGENSKIKILDRVRRLATNMIPLGESEDIYALSLTIVMLLTGQEIEILFNSQTQSWEWENWKLVSDQFASVLNRMLAVQALNRLDTAEAVLQALNFSFAPAVPPPPPPPIPAVALIPVPDPWNQSIPNSVQPPVYAFAQSSQPGTINTVSASGKNWQLAVILGSVVGLCIVGISYLFLTLKQPTQSTQQASTPPTSPLPTATDSSPQSQVLPTLPVSPIPTPQENTQSSVSTVPTPQENARVLSSTSISQQEAVKLVNYWLEAKRVMFAPPYNRQVAAVITTGKLYTSTAGSDGTIDWLERNNARYEYGLQRIEEVDQFVADGNKAAIKVKVTEQRKLIKNGRIDPEQSGFDTIAVIYNLQFVDGQWRIASSEILK